MLNLVILAHHVWMSDPIVFVDLPVTELGVQLVGCRVEGVSTRVLLITVVIIENRGLTDRHADDRASMLVCVSRAPVGVTTLGSQQNRGDVVYLVGGLCACALLRDTATLAPSMAGIQDESEEED